MTDALFVVVVVALFILAVLAVFAGLVVAAFFGIRALFDHADKGGWF